MSAENKQELSLVKMKFIEQIVAEHSLDTLREWYSMYEEARYVASLYSKEEELIKFGAEFEESIKKGFINHNNKNVEPLNP